MSNLKQVIVYRRDLKMRKGKIAAQAAHASMKVFFDRAVKEPHQLTIPLTPDMAAWVNGIFTKIVLSVDDEDALLAVFEHARERGLPCALVTDAGKTEFHGQPTHTTVALGPARSEDIDAITGREGLVATRLA